HLHASLIMIVTNFAFIGFACGFVDELGNNLMFLLILTLGFSLPYIPVWVNKVNDRKKQENEHSIKVIRLRRESSVNPSKVADNGKQ
ncbi:MAG: hypothetical protein H7X84_02305, partial [Verrucomicrobia bacterium]|nr:hypothetical protein [Prolixibacteraceae bacterium]